jgi:uncharacterized surface protein with fasciclin (FAS1) repeats
MKKRKKLTTLIATLSLSLCAFIAAPTANAAEGTKSLAEVLTAKSSYDQDGSNYDIVTAAVLAVLSAKPASPVSLLTNGTVDLTAFIPNDSAFINLVTTLTGTAPATEEAAFTAVAGLGIDTVESVLLYHVVPGKAILAADALKANGATLKTGLTGKDIFVSVSGTSITLGDYDKIATNPKVILTQVDLNSGNKQIAHGIDAVLLPVALLEPGTRSLAAILTAKNSFDNDGKNYDIVTAAVLAVLGANPDSDVKVLTTGDVALTAFIPNDKAFLSLVRSLTGKTPRTESAAFAIVASLGIPTVESILKYHVVPGGAIVSEDALRANGVSLATAEKDKSIKVSVRGSVIRLGDYDRTRPDPRVILTQVDINLGNKQVAHGIDRVLMPTN